MTAKMTCDFCDSPLELGYGNPKIQEFNIGIHSDSKKGYFRFSLKFDYHANFNTTDFHWCRECLLNATKEKIEDILHGNGEVEIC